MLYCLDEWIIVKFILEQRNIVNTLAAFNENYFKIYEFKTLFNIFSMKKLLKFSITANSLTASHRNSGPDHLQLYRYDCNITTIIINVQ